MAQNITNTEDKDIEEPDVHINEPEPDVDW